MAHLVDRVGQVVVVFEEIEGAKAQKLERDAHVAMVVKPVKHLHTEAEKRDGGRGGLMSSHLPTTPPTRRDHKAVDSICLCKNTPASITNNTQFSERMAFLANPRGELLPAKLQTIFLHVS